ncbi:hypothetical protein J6590_073199 [Homalodisca vitripennis]|nr:hypothetical protein J6590_073199 [Homalodisca vitripennis]
MQNATNIEYNNIIKNQQQVLCDKVKERLQEFLKSVEGVCTEPPFLYTVLIVMALVSSEKQSLRLSEILQFIQDKFPFYQNRESWKKSVVVTLELNSFFTKTCVNCRPQRLQDHDCDWCIDSTTATDILARAFKLQPQEMKVFGLFVDCIELTLCAGEKSLSRTESSSTARPLTRNTELQSVPR